MLITTVERGCRYHIKMINRYAWLLRRDQVSPAIHACYEEYLQNLDDDADDNKHKNHLTKIGKACALFWKAISEK